jgi:3,4-dihydroxy-9,10-secoandrosta-1,3,5(10)-triene-9,17-dione 4,5-dioxygenase
MDIRGLGYIGIDVADIHAWRDYAELLGTRVITHEDGLAIKIDDRPFRVLARPAESPEGLAFAGWELPDTTALEVCAAELEAAGCSIVRGSTAECEQRRVRGLISTVDPGGFTVEFFHGLVHDHQPFVSPTGVSGFTTGDQGMGHIVLGTPDIDASTHFYTNVLGFRISDYWRPDGSEHDVVFLHCNPRHHSLALVPAGQAALYHFMLEMNTLDDVGYTLDRHEANGTPISAGLGKHTNDYMVSFYSVSPSGFDVEIGCGGRLVDDQTWTVTQLTKPSFWGHRPPGGRPSTATPSR